MELPQPRPFGSQGRKPTHDFLSLYSPAHQDPAPTPPGYLETHDFLQPLEGLGTNVAKDGNKVEVTSIGKSFPPSHSTVEHNLPGGIGTYTISHVSYICQSQRAAQKPDGVVITAAKSSSSDKDDENSNCSSYAGSGFSLWEESDLKKGKTGKENVAGNRHVTREMGVKIGVPWTTSMEQPSQLSSIHNYASTTMSSLTSFHPSSVQKSQSFVDMLKFAKSVQEDEDDEEDEFAIKKEPSSHHKVDTENHDRKPNTPRSKHSATEQRRRSKINDRFSMLRELIPHGDQKRDKASFLLEVIEYIQFLQEKVHKYEDSYQGWNGPPKMMPWNNSQTPTDGFIDQPRLPNGVSGPPFTYATKLDENSTNVASNVPRNVQNAIDGQHPRLTNEASPLVVTVQPNPCPPASAHTSSQPQLRQSGLYTSDHCTLASDKSKDKDLVIENGAISISTIYSQGLLSTLTQALQSSGVDLSQAQVSVQIELGKTPNLSKLNSSTPTYQKTDVPSIGQTLARSRLAGTQEEDNHRGFKRSKRSRN